MKKIIVLFLLAGCTLNLSAQTKKIAHRSHSGSKNMLLMTTEDNFGLPAKPKDTAVKKPAPAVTKKKTKHKKTVKKIAVVKPAGR